LYEGIRHPPQRTEPQLRVLTPQFCSRQLENEVAPLEELEDRYSRLREESAPNDPLLSLGAGGHASVDLITLGSRD
jgi:hypothetical protein